MTKDDDMGVIAENERQINFYYYPDHKLSKESLAYAESAKADILKINLKKTKLTGTEWKELAEKLDKSVEDLIEKEHPVFREKFGKDAKLSEEDAIKILQNQPEVLVYPIAIRGDKAVQARIYSDILKLHKPDTGNVDYSDMQNL